VSPAGALNFKMLADLKGGVAGGLTQVASLGSGKGGIPFAIEGTTSDPHFVPDMKGVAGEVAQGALGGVKDVTKDNPANAITGLLGKKQK
jgi:AsmA protein